MSSAKEPNGLISIHHTYAVNAMASLLPQMSLKTISPEDIDQLAILCNNIADRMFQERTKRNQIYYGRIAQDSALQRVQVQAERNSTAGKEEPVDLFGSDEPEPKSVSKSKRRDAPPQQEEDLFG